MMWIRLKGGRNGKARPAKLTVPLTVKFTFKVEFTFETLKAFGRVSDLGVEIDDSS
jgi:hypothetical protein